MRLKVIVLCLSFMVAGKVSAEEDSIVTDRPDFTESAEVIPTGRVQVEAGWTQERSDNERTQSWGEVLVRVAAGEKTELRIGVPSYLRVKAGGDTESGFDDLFLGFKRVLKEGNGSKPQLAIIAGSTIPTGSKSVAERKYQPEVVLAASRDLTSKLGLGLNLGYARAASEGQRFNQVFGSVALGYELNNRWGCYTEVFGFSRDEPGGSSREYVNVGLTYLVNPDFQLDARIGKGLNSESESFFGFGASRRF